MRGYRQTNRLKSHIFRGGLILAAFIYSAVMCVSGVRSATLRQMEKALHTQMQESMLQTLAGEEDRVYVHLQRDKNHAVTSVTVNGILLNQLQMRYHKALTVTSWNYQICLTAADILGSKLFSFVPGHITVSLTPSVEWNVNIISRTLTNDPNSNRFQLVMITKAHAATVLFLHAELEEEVLLYETIIYTS